MTPREPPRRSCWRRVVALAAVCAGLGIVTSVGVAWGIARSNRWSPQGSKPPIRIDQGPLRGLVWKDTRFGVDDIAWEVNLSGNALRVELPNLQRAATAAGAPLPGWIGWPELVNPPEGLVATTAVGWPFRCLRSGTLPNDDGWTRRVWGVWRTHKSADRFERIISPVSAEEFLVERWPQGTLPVSVVWPGMFLNSGIYGLACAAAFGLVAGTIHWSRLAALRRRGACARCGYSLAGLTGGVCPECGTLVPMN